MYKLLNKFIKYYVYQTVCYYTDCKYYLGVNNHSDCNTCVWNDITNYIKDLIKKVRNDV